LAPYAPTWSARKVSIVTSRRFGRACGRARSHHQAPATTTTIATPMVNLCVALAVRLSNLEPAAWARPSTGSGRAPLDFFFRTDDRFYRQQKRGPAFAGPQVFQAVVLPALPALLPFLPFQPS